jgi:crotonobetainyl-CoA:carnitine CoA-transferase CaiB-like acyl-CoA transferase
VIRVEKREGGEDRYIAPIADGGEGGVFFQTGCNKQSLTLDPATPAGREIVRRLVREADVVVANLPPASLHALGLDYASLKAVRADVILVTQTSFGDRGPLADRGGFDGVGQAMSGAMYMTGQPGEPAKAAAPYVDYSTAVLAAFGTMAALMHRAKTGEGQEVKTSLLGTALAVFGSHLVEQGALTKNRTPSGNRVQTSAPSDVFATRDGHVLTHCVGDGLFRRWARLMGDADYWLTQSRFQGDQSRGDHATEILARMREWCAERTTAEALAALDAAGLPAGPVYTLQQALDEPQVAAMKFFSEVADYPGLTRPVRIPNLPVELTATPGGIAQRPPQLGEHTDAILARLGFTPGEIAELRSTKVI